MKRLNNITIILTLNLNVNKSALGKSMAAADAIKFQIFDADRLVEDKMQLFTYQKLIDRKTNELETVEEPLYDILKRRCLNNNEWLELKAYCDDIGMAFFSTVGFEEDIELLIKMNCDSNCYKQALVIVKLKAH